MLSTRDLRIKHIYEIFNFVDQFVYYQISMLSTDASFKYSKAYNDLKMTNFVFNII